MLSVFGLIVLCSTFFDYFKQKRQKKNPDNSEAPQVFEKKLELSESSRKSFNLNELSNGGFSSSNDGIAIVSIGHGRADTPEAEYVEIGEANEPSTVSCSNPDNTINNTMGESSNRNQNNKISESKHLSCKGAKNKLF